MKKIFLFSYQEPCINIVKQVFELKKTNQVTKALEYQINQMVFHLYGLTFEESFIIDKDLQKNEIEEYSI